MPIKLPCNHNICRECLLDLICSFFRNNSVPCPICNRQNYANFDVSVIGYLINRPMWIEIRRVLNDTTDTLEVLRNMLSNEAPVCHYAEYNANLPEEENNPQENPDIPSDSLLRWIAARRCK